MNRIYLAFANDRKDHLPNLKEEDEGVSHYLARREAKAHFSVGKDSFAELPRVVEYLLLFRHQLLVFMYSGHAGRNRLLMEDAPANAKGIAQLLGRCPQLKLVILNGCSTHGQVEELHRNGVPVVISTSALVGDRAATQFAISFFQEFCEQKAGLEAAFDAGVSAASSATTRELNPEKSRAIVPRSSLSQKETPLWSISYKSEAAAKAYANWKLPEEQLGQVHEPNELLIDQLMEALAPFNQEIKATLEEEQWGNQQDIDTRRQLVLKYLPHPVSEQLRKLVTPKSHNQGETFFDEPGAKRLQQIATTFSITVEFILFTMLAQLWEELVQARTAKLNMVPQDLADLQQLFKAKAQGMDASTDYLAILQSLDDLFQENDLQWFIPEIQDWIAQWKNPSRFAEACLFLETVQHRLNEEVFSDGEKLGASEAALLSIQAEEELAVFFGEICFLAQYTLASVNEIAVIKNRVMRKAKFTHNLFRLIQQFEKKLTAKFEARNKPFSNDSVLLIRWDGNEKYDFNRLKEEDVLNLSPFVIDVNSYKEKAKITKLHFFDSYLRYNGSYVFKHAYKPSEILQVDKKSKNYALLHQQFDNFSKLVFQKPLRAL